MRKYDSYKDSGIEWLGELPEHWEVKRLKDVLKTPLKYGANEPAIDEDLSNPRYIRITDFGDDEKLRIDTFKSLSYEIAKNYLLKNGDILFARSGATVGKSFQFKNYDGLACYAGYLIKASPKTSILVSDFLSYFTKSFSYDEWKENIFIQATIQNISAEKYDRLEFAVPSLAEQSEIAQYLDSKTQAIDKKVILLEKKIGYYKELRKSIINETVTKGLDKTVKLKDSGIDWIGQIPEHWEVKRFKDVVSKYTTGGTPSTSNNAYFNGDNIWITIGDIGESNLVSTSSLFLTDEAIKDANIVKTPKGSLLYSFKLSIGKMAFTTVDCYTNEAILSIFPNKNIDLMYYYMMLPSFMMLAATENIYGAKMLNQKLIANAFVLHLPKAEQTKIANYLDHKTQTIDKIVGNIQKQISTIKELRKTLINDVVTGKIKVVE